tara:strand:+ start:2251 stop:2844 length:594 start_codon:yes stop_codon:yes gene_type:complete
MIVYQSHPCRLYPKIIDSINNQFPESLHIHEYFELVDDSQSSSPNNRLNVTSKNYKLPRCEFAHGIFDSKKIDKKEGDFWFTIRPLDKAEVIKELLRGIRYFGSYYFYKKYIDDSYDSFLYPMMRKLNKETDEYLIDFVHGKDDVLLENLGVRYRFRKDLIEYSDDYDYVGSPDNWDQTVKDLKSKINLDLSHIKNA